MKSTQKDVSLVRVSRQGTGKSTRLSDHLQNLRASSSMTQLGEILRIFENFDFWVPNQHRIRIASPESGFFTILSQRVFLLNFQGDFWSTTCAGGRAYASESFPNSKSILGRSPNNLLDFGDRLKMPDDKPNSSMKVKKYNQFYSKMTKSWWKSWN